MELLCLAGAALSVVATLLEAFRDSLVFFCLWVLYLSLYQVESALKSVFRWQSWSPCFWLAGCLFRWGRSFSTSSGECWEPNCCSVLLSGPLKMSFPWLLSPILFQGQPSSGDRLPLCPRRSPDPHQRVTRGPRTRPCHILVGPLAAVQADVCLGCGQTHVSLSDVVGPHGCVRFFNILVKEEFDLH